jgi:hypothetical protein
MATLDGIIEPIYFLITSISFIILSVIQYKKFGKNRETRYLAELSALIRTHDSGFDNLRS